MSEHLTKEQQVEYRDVFSLFDKDGDGKISIKELGTVMKSLGQNVSATDLQEMVNDIQADANELIDLEGFFSLIARQIKDVDTEAEIIGAFRVFDSEKKGVIPVNKLKDVFKNLEENLSDEEIDQMIKEADIYNSGLIHYEEFVKNKMGK